METLAEYTKKQSKISKERMVRVDTDRLYSNWDTAIAYLKELKAKYPKGSLGENWYGYEDMEMVISFVEEETNEEFSDRVKHEHYLKKLDHEEAVRNNKKAQLKSQIEKLQEKMESI